MTGCADQPSWAALVSALRLAAATRQEHQQFFSKKKMQKGADEFFFSPHLQIENRLVGLIRNSRKKYTFPGTRGVGLRDLPGLKLTYSFVQDLFVHVVLISNL